VKLKLTYAQALDAGAIRKAYEVRSPSFSDMNLQQQVDAGINDWCAEGASGHQYFGQSKAEAEAIRAQYGDR
jgi:hypothetical protein